MKLSLEIDILDETTQYLTNTKPNKLIKELIKTIFKQISHENSTDLEKKIIMKQEDLKSLIRKLEKLDPNDVKELEKNQPIYSESLIFFESPLDFYISRRMIGKNLERLKNYPPSQFEALFSIVFEIANDSEKIYEGRSTNPNESYMSTRIMFIPKRIDAKDQFTMRAMWAVLQRESPNWKSKILNRLGFRISNSHFEREKEHYQQRVHNSLRATQKNNIQSVSLLRHKLSTRFKAQKKSQIKAQNSNSNSDDDLTFEELSDENGIEENSKVLILDPEKQWNLGWIHYGNLLTRYSSPNLKVSLPNDQLEEKENKRLNIFNDFILRNRKENEKLSHQDPIEILY
ncbi:hypothetical protein M0812_16973 [Anaeramoeba flamelloides]|uniref:Uncharacterized protein n=1 Tax=Anaeramoeba flamelloides TaxID=1746091 RepID=A0AAV7Z7T8_9EUKA|nr:hypothetical protein M0812_16973 [Anaeramoeba flamelloides]